jgi:hypothetical protein
MPANPFDGKNTVTASAISPPTAAGGSLYYAATAQISPNTANHLNG